MRCNLMLVHVVSTLQLMFLYLYLVYLYQFVKKICFYTISTLFTVVNYSVLSLLFQDAFYKVLLRFLSWKIMEGWLTVATRHNSQLYLITLDIKDLHYRIWFDIHLTRQWVKNIHLSYMRVQLMKNIKLCKCLVCKWAVIKVILKTEM